MFDAIYEKNKKEFNEEEAKKNHPKNVQKLREKFAPGSYNSQV